MITPYLPLYKNFLNQTRDLSDEQVGNLITACLEYAYRIRPEEEIIPKLDGKSLVAFSFLKCQIDRHIEKSWKRSQAGALGGRKKKAKANESKSAKKKEKTKKNREYNKKEGEEENEEEEEEAEGEEEGVEGDYYVVYDPPACLAEITAYVEENDLNVDPKSFIDYYTSIGWVGSDGKAIIRWKPLVRKWSIDERNDYRSRRRQNY